MVTGIRLNGKRMDITCTPEDCYLCSHLSQFRLGVAVACNDSCFIRRI
ncbi:MAG: hypothetical protein MUP55_03020 [Candidatus Aenigmarchaeota archaeon]|nr:hypothetical protein [Candidatus Aenigmarchaeota archaeon]